MTRSKSIIGALVLCALSLCAFGAASASATVGLTAVECQELPGGTGGKFNNSHCETPESPGAFETVAFPLNESKEIEGDATETSILHGTVALSEVTITCTKAHTTGKVTNVTPEGNTKEMQAHGTEAVTTYEECEAHLKSKTAAEEACQVEAITGALGKGKIKTVPLTSTTGPEHKVTFKPEAGTTFSEFNILAEKATTQACNLPKAKVTVTGETIAQASTTKHSHLTFAGEGSLKANGVAATYTGTNVGYTKANHELTVGLTTIN